MVQGPKASEGFALMPLDLQQRVADALGWPLRDVSTLSIASVRELLRPNHPKLTAEIDHLIRTGAYVVQP